MHRHAVVLVFLLAFASAEAQTGKTQPSPISDPTAVSLAQQAVNALGGGTPISDVTLSANVISVYGSDYETGTGSFAAKGTGESRVDVSLSGGTRSDVRNQLNGAPAGAWSQNGAPSTPYAQHNCWNDAAWFFPALSSLTQTANPAYIFKYIGQELHGGLNVQHLRVFQIVQSDTTGMFQRLSTQDFYLDVTTNLPDAIFAYVHPDNNAGSNITLEMRFASYQSVNGVLVPFRFQQMFDGGVVLDAKVTNVVLNTGLLESLFTLP